MRSRRNVAPPAVETRHRRRAAPAAPAPARPAADPRRVWRADDVEQRELEAFNRLTDLQQKQAAIAAACQTLRARLHRANDSRVYEELARQQVDVWAVNNSVSHIVEVPRPADGSPRHLRIYALDAASKSSAHHARLRDSFFGLFPNAKRIVSDPRAPKKLRWWECIKDFRKRD